MAVALRPISIPDFSAPGEQPGIPAATYAARCDALAARAATDWVAVYADREHFANIAFLTGFEPRFEEALLLLGAGRRVLVVGNECESYTPIAGLSGCETVLCPMKGLVFMNPMGSLRWCPRAVGEALAWDGGRTGADMKTRLVGQRCASAHYCGRIAALDAQRPQARLPTQSEWPSSRRTK